MKVGNISQTVRNYVAKITQVDRRNGTEKTERLKNTLIDIKNATNDHRPLSSIHAQRRRGKLATATSKTIGIINGSSAGNLKASLREVRSQLKEIRSLEKSIRQDMGRRTSAPIKVDSQLGAMRQESDKLIKWLDGKIIELK